MSDFSEHSARGTGELEGSRFQADEPAAPEEVSDLEAPPEDPEDGDGLAPPESDVTELSESESGVEPPLEKLEASKAANQKQHSFFRRQTTCLFVVSSVGLTT